MVTDSKESGAVPKIIKGIVAQLECEPGLLILCSRLPSVPIPTYSTVWAMLFLF
jgi:hypothetical protein